MIQNLTARVADYCVRRPGMRFTANDVAAALAAPLASVTSILGQLVKDGINGTLTASNGGYVFTDDPSAGNAVSCTCPGCTPQTMCADCAEILIDILTAEQARQLGQHDDPEAGQLRAAALGRRIAWIRAHTQPVIEGDHT